MPLQLNPYETLLAKKAEAAELCDFTVIQFSEKNLPEIRGEAIRALMLGLPVRYVDSDEEKVVKIGGLGVGLKGPARSEQSGIDLLQARITGALNLDHACGPGNSPLPNLSLYACNFDEAIRLEHAHMRSLILAGCRFKHVHAPYAVFEGGVDISCVSSSEATGEQTGLDGKGQCWANFTGANIEAAFRAEGAQLVAPEKRPDEEIEVELPRYALQLNHSHIGASLDLRNGFQALGGLTIDMASIGGHFRGCGLRLVAGEKHALDAQLATIGGGFDFRPLMRKDGSGDISRLVGDMFIPGLKLGGQLMLTGTQIKGDLSAFEAIFHTDVHLWPATSKKDGLDETFPFSARNILLYASKIGGDLTMYGVQLEGYFEASNAEFAKDVSLTASLVPKGDQYEIAPCFAKYIGLFAAKIGGNLTILGTTLEGGLTAHNAQIRGSVNLGSVTVPLNGIQETVHFRAKAVTFGEANVGGHFEIRGANLENDLSAHNAKFDGNVFLGAIDEGKKNGQDEIILFTATRVNFDRANIVGNFEISGAQLDGDLSASTAEIGGAIKIEPANGKVDGQYETLVFQASSVNFNGIRLGDELVMTGAHLLTGMKARHADIDGDLKLNLYEDGRNTNRQQSFPFRSAQDVDISGAVIRGDLDLSGAQLEAELSAANTEIGGDVKLSSVFGFKSGKRHKFRFCSSNTVNFLGANVGQDFILKDARLGWWRVLRLKHLNVAGTAKFGYTFAKFHFGHRGEIGLSLLRVSLLVSLVWFVGWASVLVADQGPSAISWPYQFEITTLPAPVSEKNFLAMYQRQKRRFTLNRFCNFSLRFIPQVGCNDSLRVRWRQLFQVRFGKAILEIRL